MRISTDLGLELTSRGNKRPLVCTPVSAHLSDRGINVETYYFSYPTIEDLLKLVDNEEDGLVSGWTWRGAKLEQLLRQAGMVRMDDFVTTSPLALHLSCGIPTRGVELLYMGAEKMIHLFHRQMAPEIKDIRDLKEEYGQLLESMGEA